MMITTVRCEHATSVGERRSGGIRETFRVDTGGGRRVATLGGWLRPSTSPAPAYDRLKAEHDDLTTRGRIDIARKIEAARELGDLSENGDYHAAKEEQGKMEGRIIHLASLLENAEIVEGGERRRRGRRPARSCRSATRATTTSSATCSARSRSGSTASTSCRPVAARRGADRPQPGDTVEYETPTGATLKVEIVAVGD